MIGVRLRGQCVQSGPPNHPGHVQKPAQLQITKEIISTLISFATQILCDRIFETQTLSGPTFALVKIIDALNKISSKNTDPGLELRDRPGSGLGPTHPLNLERRGTREKILTQIIAQRLLKIYLKFRLFKINFKKLHLAPFLNKYRHL